MRAILEIQGWKKIVDIDPYYFYQRKITIPLYPPMNYLLPEVGEKAERTEIKHVTLLYQGRDLDRGFPLFKWE